MREFGDQGAENERVETWRAERECRVHKGITELHPTLNPEGRDSAGHAQKRNNGSRTPYIKPQGAGSRSVDHEESNQQDQSRYQRDQSVNQVNYKGATTSLVVGKQRRGSQQRAKSLRRDVRDWDARNLRIETLVAEAQRASHG